MGTAWMFALWESIHRRMGSVLLVVSAIACIAQLYFVRYQTVGGKVMVHVGNTTIDAQKFAGDFFTGSLSMTTSLWLFIAIFASAPLLTSFLEKGWAELVFAKGIARWQMFAARYLACLTLFAAALLLIDGIPAFVFWLHTGFKPWHLLGALGFVFFSFAVLLAMMTLFGVTTGNAAVPILVAFLQLVLSSALAEGRKPMEDFFTSTLVRGAIEWVYRILPKNSELHSLATTYWRSQLHLTTFYPRLAPGQNVDYWWPVWTSALFMLVMLALSHVVLTRKDL